MLIDYHIHTVMSDGAEGELEAYVHEARANGVSEIGFSDHFHVQKQSYSMSLEKLMQYVGKVTAFKEESSFPVKLGLEVDYLPQLEKGIERILDDGRFDYVIGSVHFIDDWGFDDPKYVSQYQKWDLSQLYRTYFGLVRQCAESQLFDIIAHIDLIKKFGFKPAEDMKKVFAEAAEAVKRSNMCIEVNTGGLREVCREIYPSEPLLKACFDLGIPITLGSDAHRPESVGVDFNDALSLVRQVGYEYATRFSQRKRTLVKL